MPRFDLAQMARQKGKRRNITLRKIDPPATMATNLYRSAYLPVIQLWTRGAERIMEIYSRTLAEMQTDSPNDVVGEIDRLGAAMQSVVLALTPDIRDWVYRVETQVRNRWRGAVLSATGVDLGTFIGPADVRLSIEAVTARNAALVRDVGAQAQGRIADAVFRGLQNRTPAREVAAAIRESVAMSRRRALNIASHQLSALQNELAAERRREAGIDTWAWVHSGKIHAREDHLARDGKIFSDDNPPPEMPGELPFCGCTSRAVLIIPDA